jgi:6-phosphogluconolactonase
MENLTRRSVLRGLSTALIAAPMLSLGKQLGAETSAESLMFVGGYTDQGSKSLGVYAYRWNARKGEMASLGLAAATPNPSFLAIAKDRRSLYAVNEVDNFQGAKDGSVSSFALDQQTGKLRLLNVVSSGGSGPCNINLDHTGGTVFVANYTGGSASSYRVLDGGKLSTPVANIHYEGHGFDPKKRQETPHAHCVTASPDNRYLLVNDLGLDRIHVYHFNAATSKLIPNIPPAYVGMQQSGPRSFAFHPNGRFAYSTNELSNSLDALQWDAAKGTLTRLQNISTLPAGEGEGNSAASVNVDAEGKFVYASNRGPDNSIVVYAVDAGSGKLSLVQHIDSGGKIPRHFAIDPSGNWIVVAHQGSHTLVVFARDKATGKLSATGRVYPIDWPTCVLFA